MKRSFYITTPIYYVNDKPHIGHAYTTILADVLARYHRMRGQEVFFLTGLDEHGQKVFQAAQQRGRTPQEHCDELAPRFLDLWKELEIQYDDFIRTTQSRHAAVVRHVLQKVYDAGDIYPAEYEGWYSVSEERFITETEKASGAFRDVRRLKERNWFFRMSRYQQRLIGYIQQNPLFLRPEWRRNEILGFLRQPLGDLCISRPKARMSWGIELPFDQDYVTYVWFDALLNYITAAGYLDDRQRFDRLWPASMHLIGKDILTTHAVYWSTMLMALDLPLPETIFAHGWWLRGETKMSKSLGNVVDPLDLIKDYGVDAVRYYLMSEMVLGQDASFTMEGFIKRYNSDLANDFGNLLNRVSGLIGKYFQGRIPSPAGNQPVEDQLKAGFAALIDRVDRQIEDIHVHTAIAEILTMVSRTNKYMEAQAPWSVAKTDPARAGTVLYTATEALRIAAVFLAPVMPAKTRQVLEVIGAVGTDRQWGGLTPGTSLKGHQALFPRIENKTK